MPKYTVGWEVGCQAYIFGRSHAKRFCADESCKHKKLKVVMVPGIYLCGQVSVKNVAQIKETIRAITQDIIHPQGFVEITERKL
jgi:hypothetical protein